MSVNRRILIGKPGLDGHDRGAKYVAQVLRDAGFEVIYTGIRRTPEQIVWSALQEDVAAIGLSLLSGAHMVLFTQVLTLLRDAGADDIPVFGGGVMPDDDCRLLQSQGVAALFVTGAPAAEIVRGVEAIVSSRAPADSPQALACTLADLASSESQRMRAAARLISLLENEPEQWSAVEPIVNHTATNATSMVVGVTGAPGAGKSTMLGALLTALRQRHPQHRLGLIAVDPSSAVSGGAVLGDRIRMMHLAGDPGVLIRSMASRGRLGGLCAAVQHAVAILRAMQCNMIFVETVGIGQNEAEVTGLADHTMLVLAPGQGDDVQMLKAGVVELADIIVVNKADQPQAQTTHHHVLQARQCQQWTHVALVSSTNGQGVAELADHLNYIASDHTTGTTS